MNCSVLSNNMLPFAFCQDANLARFSMNLSCRLVFLKGWPQSKRTMILDKEGAVTPSASLFSLYWECVFSFLFLVLNVFHPSPNYSSVENWSTVFMVLAYTWLVSVKTINLKGQNHKKKWNLLTQTKGKDDCRRYECLFHCNMTPMMVMIMIIIIVINQTCDPHLWWNLSQ